MQNIARLISITFNFAVTVKWERRHAANLLFGTETHKKLSQDDQNLSLELQRDPSGDLFARVRDRMSVDSGEPLDVARFQ